MGNIEVKVINEIIRCLQDRKRAALSEKQEFDFSQTMDSLRQTKFLEHIKSLIETKLLESDISCNEGMVLLLSIFMQDCLASGIGSFSSELCMSNDGDMIKMNGKSSSLELKTIPNLKEMRLYMQNNGYKMDFRVKDGVIKCDIYSIANGLIVGRYECRFEYDEDGLPKCGTTEVKNRSISPDAAFCSKFVDVCRTISYGDSSYDIQENAVIKSSDSSNPTFKKEVPVINNHYPYHYLLTRVYPSDFLTGDMLRGNPYDDKEQEHLRACFPELFHMAEKRITSGDNKQTTI